MTREDIDTSMDTAPVGDVADLAAEQNNPVSAVMVENNVAAPAEGDLGANDSAEATSPTDQITLQQPADTASGVLEEDPLEALAVQFVAQADAAAAAAGEQVDDSVGEILAQDDTGAVGDSDTTDGTLNASPISTDADNDGDGAAQPSAASSNTALGADASEAMAALDTDEGIAEVADPDPATLVNPIPPLKDIPDDAPYRPTPPRRIAARPSSTQAAETGTAVWSASDVQAAMQADDAARAAAGTQYGAGSDETQAAANDDDATGPDIDHIEAMAFAHEGTSPSQTLPFSAVEAELPIQPRVTERMSGAAKGTGSLAWGSRSDVGCVRDHNEDSYLVQFPLFAIADGMGGHEAGEIASTIAVSSLAAANLTLLDAPALGHAIEAANSAVIQAAESGLGRPGMGTTCTAVYIDGNQMAVGHVGDSRCYLLHAGQLVRVTHDHSYVEELVAAGKITPDEARVHPNRSVITRALGSDPAMYADAFTIDLSRGDRVLLCSDGLNSMVTDDLIEEAMVTTPTPQNCADALVELALDAGGYDNVTCVVVDVKDDGTQANALRARVRNVAIAIAVALVVLLVVGIAMFGYANNTWYLDDENGYVTLHRGIPGDWGPLPFNELIETTDVKTSKLSDIVETRLHAGITFGTAEEARAVIDDYRAQIDTAEAAKAEAAEKIDDARRAAGSEGTPQDQTVEEAEAAAADGDELPDAEGAA